MVTAVAGPGRSVVVLGMHRSGTSAMTRVVNLLGPSLCREDDLYVADDNPTGHWESKTLVAFNDRLLGLLGGNVTVPALPHRGWQQSEPIRSLYPEAIQSFRSVHPSTPWVWKDPRTCLTWPFWRSILDEDPVALLVLRNPLEVTRSLARRGDRIGTAHALALWERYTHDALVAIAGGPVIVVDYAAVVTDPKRAVTALAAQLRNAGVQVRQEQISEAASFLGETTSHRVTAALELRDLNGAQRELIRYVHQLASDPNAEVVHSEIPPLSAATIELLDALRLERHAMLRRVPVHQAFMTSPLVVEVRKRAAIRTRLRLLRPFVGVQAIARKRLPRRPCTEAASITPRSTERQLVEHGREG